MAVLIFGGTGLIGSYVAADLCDRGEEVTVFDLGHPQGILQAHEGRFRRIEGNISDAAQVVRAVEESEARRIVHLAAMLQFDCEQDPREAMQVNVGGTINVLEAARQGGVERVVFASSGAAYGFRGGPLHEDTSLGPGLSIYGATKLLGERLGAQYSDQYGFDFIALRYGLTFGPGTVTSPGMAKVLHDIESTMDGRSITIWEVGGDLHRQITYVRDTAAATVLALTHRKPSHRLYNVAGPDENYVSLEEFHETLRRTVPGTGIVTFAGKGRESGPLDTTRIRQDLGFAPKYSIAEGIRAKLEDMRKWS